MITAHHIVWALLNSIWQSAALAALIFLLLKAAPRSTAAQRYAMWCAVLAAAALLPFANLVLAQVTQPRQVSLGMPSLAAPAEPVEPIGSTRHIFALSTSSYAPNARTNKPCDREQPSDRRSNAKVYVGTIGHLGHARSLRLGTRACVACCDESLDSPACFWVCEPLSRQEGAFVSNPERTRARSLSRIDCQVRWRSGTRPRFANHAL